MSSPAPRALETAHVFAERFEYPVQRIVLQEKFYDSNQVSELVDVIRGADEAHDAVAVFGHEPSISDLATALVPRFQQGLPKSAVVGIRFPAEHWRDVAPGRGELDYFDAPVSKTERERLEKQIRKALEHHIGTHLEKVLVELEAAEVPAARKRVESAARELARDLMAATRKRGHAQRWWAQLQLAAQEGESTP
jgi:hypothetical protein